MIQIILIVLMVVMAYLGFVVMALVIGLLIYNFFSKEIWDDYNDFLKYITFNVIDINGA